MQQDEFELLVECKNDRIFVLGDASLSATLEVQDCPEYPVHVESRGGVFALPSIPLQQGIKKLVADTKHFTIIVTPKA